MEALKETNEAISRARRPTGTTNVEGCRGRMAAATSTGGVGYASSSNALGAVEVQTRPASFALDAVACREPAKADLAILMSQRMQLPIAFLSSKLAKFLSPNLVANPYRQLFSLIGLKIRSKL